MKKLKQLILSVLLLNFIYSYGQNSVLSSGEWQKIEINSSGLFKIDYAALVQMGFANVNPRNIKVYGYGGILAQKNSDFRYGDIVENPILFKGEEDGVLNSGDYILFYGQGPNEITEKSSGYLAHEKNPYSSSSFYYLCATDNLGKRIKIQSQAVSIQNKYNSLPYLIFHENDEVNVTKSGREWVGDPFRYKPNYYFNFDLEDINSDSSVLYEFKYAGGSELYTTEFKTVLNSTVVKTNSVSLVARTYGPKANEIVQNGSLKVNNSIVNINSSYDNKGDGAATAYIDYLRFVYFRALNGNRSTEFVIPKAFRNSEISISNVTNLTRVWDVSRVDSIFEIKVDNNKVLIGEETKTILVVNENNYQSPKIIGSVKNQNIRMMDVPELLIVTNDQLLESAMALAEYKNNIAKIKTGVVTVNQIYNEFSSGSQDVSAIKDFGRFLYNRDNSYKYLLLFGDCSYDYFNRLSGNTNFVPIYESRSSFNNTTSFSSDDFFGFYGDEEGDWQENDSAQDDMDVGIGRLPVKSNQEGYIMIEKIKNYVSSANSKGNWRNKAIFVADDGDNQLHTKHSDDLSKELQSKQPGINISKIFLDAYEQVSSSGGQIAPQVNEEFSRKLDKGALIVNYTGHGSEEQWTQELIFTLGEINQMKNINRLPFFITATCEFGRYDDPIAESGGERLLLNPHGGAIGLMTTTRPVYANSNYTINSSFYKNAFIRNKDNTFDNLGEVQRRTKNESIVSFYNRNFALLGDPSIKLAYPDYTIKVDTINGKSTALIDTISALEKVKIKGHIEDLSNTLDKTFNGTLILTVYDKSNNVTTLGDRGETPFEFIERTSVVFEGAVNIIKGEYVVEFVVPKDISYSYGLGKVSLYAVNTFGQEASGYEGNIYIGGGLDGFNDNIGPDVVLYMDDTTFVSGSITSPNPVFYAKILDENGINTTNTGIGHEMTLTIDDDRNQTYVLNDYHSSIENTYQKGLVKFPLYNLSKGQHKLVFKVWDVNNNSTESVIYLNVMENGAITVYPNPFNEKVNIYIDQPRQEIGGQVEINIFNLMGNPVWSQTVDFDSFTSVIDNVIWDGVNFNEEKISSGVYISVINVRYEDGMSNFTENIKLVLQK